MSLMHSLSLTKAKRAAAKVRASQATHSFDTSRRNRRGLDWFSFFCANLQTGFGPFVSVYLTTEKWTQTDIGLVLMIGGLIGLFGQIPGGALVDRTRSKTTIAGLSVILIGLAGLMVALSSFFPLILLAWVLHAAASCLLSPSIATVSLELVGHAGISQRLGRNATFASVGSALAAAGMGAFGYYVSNQAVFFVTAALAVPALFALWSIGPTPATRAPAEPGKAKLEDAKPVTTKPVSIRPLADQDSLIPAPPLIADLRAFLGNRALVVLSLSIALFYLSNSAMLPLIGSMLTLRSAHSPTLFIAACIIVPQIMVAFLSPLVGTTAQSWGRRPLLLIGFLALPLRGLGLALVTNPSMLVAVQILDGVSASVLGVVIPLIAADVTRGNDRYALAQGVLGTAMGLGAAFSTTIAGVVTDKFGSGIAFFGLTAIAFVALLVPLVAMPETRGDTRSDEAR